MKKTVLLFASLLLYFSHLTAQCSGNRYHDFVFPANPTITSNIQYGSNKTVLDSTQTLLMDVYQPTGDTATARALVIIAHGGSFIFGTKEGSDVVPYSKDLAKLGYVVASIDYRLGMNNFPFPGPDSSDATEAVIRAVHDARAAVRFFRKDAAIGSNIYKIDTNNIFFAGISAGGFMALQLAYLDELSEIPTFVDTTIQFGLHGGIEGLSGNPGYSSDVKAIINICGAIGDTTWMQTGDEPILSFHGTNDDVVPFGSDTIFLFGIYPLLQVHGSSSVAARANHIGLTNCFDIYQGQGHVPSSAPYYDTTLTITRNFLEYFTCGVPLECNYTATPVSVYDIVNETGFNIYPNPATHNVTIDLAKFKKETVTIELYDALGSKIKGSVHLKTDCYTLARGNLPNGMYVINVICRGKLYSKKIIFE